MRYVIGKTDYNFIRINFRTMWDGARKIWDEVDEVFYDCNIEEATAISSYDEAKEILNEIQNRISEIDFSNISIIGQIVDEANEFNKDNYVKKLKIFKLVPTLVKD